MGSQPLLAQISNPQISNPVQGFVLIIYYFLLPGVFIVGRFGNDAARSLFPLVMLIGFLDVMLVLVLWLIKRYLVSKNGPAASGVRFMRLLWVAFIIFSAFLWYAIISFVVFDGLSSAI